MEPEDPVAAIADHDAMNACSRDDTGDHLPTGWQPNFAHSGEGKWPTILFASYLTQHAQEAAQGRDVGIRLLDHCKVACAPQDHQF